MPFSTPRTSCGARRSRDKSDYEEHHLHLTQLLEYLKEEYRKIESDVGLPLEKILSAESVYRRRSTMASSGTRFIPSEYRIVWDALMHSEIYLESRASRAESDDERLNFYGLLEDVDGAKKFPGRGRTERLPAEARAVTPSIREDLDIVKPRR